MLHLVQNESGGGEKRRSESSVKCGGKAAGTIDEVAVSFGHWEICSHCRTSVRQMTEVDVRDGSGLISSLKK